MSRKCLGITAIAERMKEVGVGKKNEGRGDVWFGVTEGSSVCDERTTIISTELQDLEQDS